MDAAPRLPVPQCLLHVDPSFRPTRDGHGGDGEDLGVRFDHAPGNRHAPELIVVPFPAADIPKLPAAAGNVAFPHALEQIMPDLTADPTSGAVK